MKTEAPGSDSLTSGPPWVACWRGPFDYEVGQHLALDRLASCKIQLKLSQLRCPFSDIASRIRVVEYGSQWV
jgi:hypothetical protein